MSTYIDVLHVMLHIMQQCRATTIVKRPAEQLAREQRVRCRTDAPEVNLDVQTHKLSKSRRRV